MDSARPGTGTQRQVGALHQAGTVVRQAGRQRLRAALHTVWSARPPTRGHRLLYYHSIDGAGPPSVPPDDLDRQLGHLRDAGYRFLTQGEVAAHRADPTDPPWVVVGFDDGYADNHEVAAPILARHGVRATFYVVAGQVHADSRLPEPGYRFYPDRRMLSVSQVRELAAQGHEIASHGLSHELATSVLRQGRDLTAELRRSRELLSRWAGGEVTSYSYPNGQNGSHSTATRDCLLRAGFTSAAGTLWGTVTGRSDSMLLPRCEIGHGDGADGFAAKVSGAMDFLFLAHRIRRRPTW